tara:strand:- start:3904 stop:4113 length:210 start_codon:yes stop_codon:yes gene_type:complete
MAQTNQKNLIQNFEYTMSYDRLSDFIIENINEEQFIQIINSRVFEDDVHIVINNIVEAYLEAFIEQKSK